MGVLFFNGPVQNGDFTFTQQPGKATGIRIAEALNAILDTPAVPHLWNTATLSGDLRHRALAQAPLSRRATEARLIAAKYPPGTVPQAGTVTDTDPAVCALALEMIERHLSEGTLSIASIPGRVCGRCTHMTGSGSHPCRACGHTLTRAHTSPQLIADRDPARPVLTRQDLYGSSRPPAHLLNIARNAPERLVLSRTRDHGISLAPLSLGGLVLDSRAALHITVLTAARQHGRDLVAMTTTQNAAANIAAHGQLFKEHDGLRLVYAIHGKIPYDDPETLTRLCEIHRAGPAVRELFLHWFLPLCSLRERSGITTAQLPGLLKFLRRALLAQPATPDSTTLSALREAVITGDPRWIMNIRALPHALPALRDPAQPPR